MMARTPADSSAARPPFFSPDGLRCHYAELGAVSLSPDVTKETDIEHLQAQGNKLCDLPAELCKLDQLIELEIQQNNFKTLPNVVCELPSLSLLRASKNFLQSLPPGLKKLMKLKAIELDDNAFTEFPTVLTEIKSLKILILDSNFLISLPVEIGMMDKQLTHLSLGKNQLRALPDDVCNLKHLTHLNVSYNMLETLPNNFGNLKKLRELYLHSNRITVLPTSILHLTNLVTMTLQNNFLSQLPPGFSSCLKKITYLSVDQIPEAHTPVSACDVRIQGVRHCEGGASKERVFRIRPDASDVTQSTGPTSGLRKRRAPNEKEPTDKVTKKGTRTRRSNRNLNKKPK
uniref:Protein scribble homolog n=1 Tax=Saccoglossus kowalevskii TaxID=10224 RepID=A0ABM0LX84_SACKO|nr:PREDICTED: protein scribble homolog [Saccoglossus kowalevskii]